MTQVESTIRLTSFAIYKVHGKRGAPGSNIEILHGASAARFNSEGGVELLADSVPFHSATFKGRAPREHQGLLMLYGIRDGLEEMHFWRTKARETGAEFASVEYEFRVGHIEVGLSDRAILKARGSDTKFVNLRRFKSGLQSEVLHRFTEYVASEGGNMDEEMSRISQIATRPDLFGKLFEDDSVLGKLDIMVIPVADDIDAPTRMRQMAYVRPGADLVATVQGNNGAAILLPAWMKDKATAKRYLARVAA